MSKDNGGPAFPMGANEYSGTGPELGMTLRDYFAAKATDEDIKSRMWVRVTRHAFRKAMTREQAKYAYADAMLLERNK